MIAGKVVEHTCEDVDQYGFIGRDTDFYPNSGIFLVFSFKDLMLFAAEPAGHRFTRSSLDFVVPDPRNVGITVAVKSFQVTCRCQNAPYNLIWTSL
jgi:hypothetical protein